MCARRVPEVTDRRQQLIDTARKLFAQRPYDQVTTSEIAKKAGVAYGLIAHHFENKRGLYLAVMNEIAVEIAAVQLSPPPEGASLTDQLRHALRSHISYIDSYAESFVALVRGQLGSDPDQQNTVDKLRWLGAQRILLAVGITEPIPPVLRTAMHGWVGYLDEMMIDRINTGDVDREVLVELAAATLVTTLQAARILDPSITLPAPIVKVLKTFRVTAEAVERS
ncbi:TetR/AcrR family transcriptional regulator [Mycobacterium vicinigordonae]|uniref:TetR/AcrR family transcriptional regulator n=1 Tax=Mycobacterium vicinigordonae TaxID=1719132 RepID=A0A7D6DW39_9MYCO|nr:TetR/AcrR family transcriptional regulator [Mycobacterium vicinigordonae]QLL05330.1 TetR/AcrR family transcriptional regulator [Mycobacterium vicinigordonae]